MCLGVLLCHGKPMEKAKVFYGVLQEGGLEKHEFIAAEDRDFPDIFKKLCMLATVHLFEWAKDTNQAPENPFADDAERLSKAPTNMIETFLDDMFGYDSKLDNDQWLKSITDKQKWIFSSDGVREAVFKAANVTYQV